MREAYMRRKLEDALKEGFQAERIVAVTGAYHVAGLAGEEPAMTDAQLGLLPSVPCNVTLMPYSYYRLSTRSGYGAGNQAPAYYGMLWQALLEGDRDMGTYRYLTAISGYQRQHGFRYPLPGSLRQWNWPGPWPALRDTACPPCAI